MAGDGALLFLTPRGCSALLLRQCRGQRRGQCRLLLTYHLLIWCCPLFLWRHAFDLRYACLARGTRVHAQSIHLNTAVSCLDGAAAFCGVRYTKCVSRPLPGTGPIRLVQLFVCL